MNQITRHVLTPCPGCAKPLDARTLVRTFEQTHDAMPGSTTMCLYCGTLCVYTRTMKLRLMTPRELRLMPAETRELFAQMEIKRRLILAAEPTKQ